MSAFDAAATRNRLAADDLLTVAEDKARASKLDPETDRFAQTAKAVNPMSAKPWTRGADTVFGSNSDKPANRTTS